MDGSENVGDVVYPGTECPGLSSGGGGFLALDFLD